MASIRATVLKLKPIDLNSAQGEPKLRHHTVKSVVFHLEQDQPAMKHCHGAKMVVDKPATLPEPTRIKLKKWMHRSLTRHRCGLNSTREESPGSPIKALLAHITKPKSVLKVRKQSDAPADDFVVGNGYELPNCRSTGKVKEFTFEPQSPTNHRQFAQIRHRSYSAHHPQSTRLSINRNQSVNQSKSRGAHSKIFQSVDEQLNEYFEGHLPHIENDMAEMPNREGLTFLSGHFFEEHKLSNKVDRSIGWHGGGSTSRQSTNLAAGRTKHPRRHQSAPHSRQFRNHSAPSHHHRNESNCHLSGRRGGAKERRHNFGCEGDLPHADLLLDKFMRSYEQELTEKPRPVPVLHSSLSGPLLRRQQTMETPPQMLVILTYAQSVEFVTVTIKAARDLGRVECPLVVVSIFEDNRLIDRRETKATGFKRDISEFTFGQSFLHATSMSRLLRTNFVIEVYDTTEEGEEEDYHLIGRQIIGPRGTRSGYKQWQQLIKHPRMPTSIWHKLI